MLLALSLLASFSCAFNHLSPIFTAFAPQFNCQNGTEFNSQCPDGEIDLEKCVFDSNVMSRTVVTDFGLVCGGEGRKPVITSSYMAGVVIFNLLSGFLSDRFGRRRILLLFSLIHVSASFLTAAANSYWFYIVVRFFVGGTIHGVWTTTFVIASEVGVRGRRGFVTGVLNVGWNFGAMLMVTLAYLWRDWVFMQISFAVTASFLALFYFLIPESPRWLMLNGRQDDAREAYQRIAKFNGVEIDNSGFHKDFQELCAKCVDDKTTESSWRQWKAHLSSAEYRTRLLLLIPPWFAVGMSSYGIHFSVSLVQFDIFTVSLLKEGVTAAMILLLMPVYNRSLRSPLLLIVYLIDGALALSFFLVLPSAAVTARVVIFILTQSLIIASFFLVDAFTPELFSTDTRNSTFAMLDSISKIGTTVAPFVVALGTADPDRPMMVFGILMAVSSLVFLFTQETRDRPLLQNVQDMEKQEKDRIFDKIARK